MLKFRMLTFMGIMLAALPISARQAPSGSGTHHNTDRPPGLRADCRESSNQGMDLNINNVRARLRVGGDIWWDGDQARYVVPNVAPGEIEVSSLFAGGIWLGAVAEGGNLIVAASTYQEDGVDYFPGPLMQECNPRERPGFTDQQTCASWDKQFMVYGAEIDSLKMHKEPSRNLLGWPGRGNPHFEGIHNFSLPNQNLAPFLDYDGDGMYDPKQGDYPIIEVRDCDKQIYADQMIWWVYNDAGNIHNESKGSPMYMEIQALAFSFKTSDELNNMTFYRYKLLNKNNVTLNDTYFSVWSDPDLGNPEDDFIGCDTARNLGIVYNADPDDDRTAIGNSPGYGSPTPALGVDYFRGPLGNEPDYTKPQDTIRDCDGNVIDYAYVNKPVGLSSFVYYDRDGSSTTGNPGGATEYYNLMKGLWKDGTCYTPDGNGNTGSSECTKFVFPSDPEEVGGWSMCSESVTPGDFRFLHSSGPFTLLPGATNELITGVVWIPKHLVGTSCASFRPLINADEKAQALFDNCFEVLEGPQAPDLEVVEMDQELVLILNESEGCTKNKNCGLAYEEIDPQSPANAADRTYNFEGYRIYQLANANVSSAELDNPEVAREIFQTDIKNGVSKIINWVEDEELDANIPEVRVEGNDKGIRTSIKVTQDQFAKNDKTLVNHKKYYYKVVAYAYNEYAPFIAAEKTGQRSPYLQGNDNVITHTAIPRINAPEYYGMVLNSKFGDGIDLSRADGAGNDGGQLEIKDAPDFENKMFDNNGVNHEITYLGGTAPISVTINNPIRVPESDFVLTVFDHDQTNGELEVSDDIRWQLQAVNAAQNVEQTWVSQYPIENNVDQAILELGLTIKAVQHDSLGHEKDDPTGLVGRSAEFRSGGKFMMTAPDIDNIGGAVPSLFNYLKNKHGEPDEDLDSLQSYSVSPDTFASWVPVFLPDGVIRTDVYDRPDYYLSPLYVRDDVEYVSYFLDYKKMPKLAYQSVGNVNVVITPDKSKWSRCIVTETANAFYYSLKGLRLPKPGGKTMFSVKGSPSVDKNGQPDGSGTGYGWFPGFAYNVETGERLNLFFGENGYFKPGSTVFEGATNGDDMLFNPSDISFLDRNKNGTGIIEDFSEVVFGGQHFVYVTQDPYNGCNDYKTNLDANNSIQREVKLRDFLKHVSWASMLMATPGNSMLGGIPKGEVCYKMRVQQPFARKVGTNINNGYPYYKFSTKGLAAKTTDAATESSALDLINIVPNPYYAYSEYESNETQQIIKITNLPPKCNIKIYSLDGRFIREYKRNLSPAEIPGWRQDTPTSNLPYIDGGYVTDFATGNPFYAGSGAENQILTSQEWDLKNAYNVPVSSGVYLVYVEVPGVGTRTLKSFIINRSYDAQRL